MLCSKCGKDNKENSKFCQHCGAQFVLSGNNVTVKITELDVRFYSKEWLRTWGIATVPRVDIIIDQKNFSLIKFPPSYFSTVCFVVGLIVLNLLGAVIGVAIGSYLDKQRRERLRLTWVNSEGDVTSAEYRNYIYLTIPLNDLKGKIELKGGRGIRIEHENKKFVLKAKKSERERIENYLKKQTYVL